MDELAALRSLAQAMGVHTRYVDGLRRRVTVAPNTLVRVCAALGAPIERPSDAPECLRARQASGQTRLLPPVLVAWDGSLPPLAIPGAAPIHTTLTLEDGDTS